MNKNRRTGHGLLSRFERFDKPIFFFLVIATILAVYLLLDASDVYRILLVGSVAFISSTVINLLVKVSIRSARPEGRVTSKDHILTPLVRYSFPSYHTQIGFTMTTVASMFMRTYSMLIPVVLFALAIFTAYSRLALKAHYPKDIIAGAIIGTSIGLMVYYWLGDVVSPLLSVMMFASTLGLFFAIPFGKPMMPKQEKARN